MLKASTNVSKGLLVLLAIGISAFAAHAQNFHNAPASVKELKNPYEGQPPAAAKRLFHLKCARCHGENGEGSGNIPSLKGDINDGMPSWATLPKRQRWQIVNYVKSLAASPGEGEKSKAEAPQVAANLNLPPPAPPFTDFRYEKPGKTRKITVKDIPPPLATPSSGNVPKVVPRPANAWPQVPPGFKVELYASGLQEPRLIRKAPNGDIFLAESMAGEIKIFRGITSAGKAEQTAVFASDLKRPFGINFYPPGPDPQWVYVANMKSVVRFPYKNGDLKARGSAQHIADLPGGEYHWTRDIQFSLDGKKMFVSIGSNSNVDDPDSSPGEKNTADILQFNPDGSGMRVYASGIRNPVGLAIQPKTGDLWCSTNERDGLGDNVVPDYITHVQDGGFYGWPWWYMGGHQDPRHKGKHPELKDNVITPDVLVHPHNASLEMTFYDGKQFPAEYQGDIFAAEHGSWNRSVRVGYELIRVALHQTGGASGEYQDFMTGFVIDNKNVWGRPVGVAVATDGSLLVTDDGSNSIWRISYTGK